jgi:hypothetical protein
MICFGNHIGMSSVKALFDTALDQPQAKVLTIFQPTWVAAAATAPLI